MEKGELSCSRPKSESKTQTNQPFDVWCLKRWVPAGHQEDVTCSSDKGFDMHEVIVLEESGSGALGVEKEVQRITPS